MPTIQEQKISNEHMYIKMTRKTRVYPFGSLVQYGGAHSQSQED